MARSSTSRRKRAPRPAAPRTAPAVPRNSGSSLRRMLYKWLWTYKIWTLPPLGIMFIITVWALYTSGGNGAWKFVTLLFIEGVLLGAYHYVVGKPNGPLGKMPKVGKTAIVILITIPVFCWYFWALKPDWYETWRNGKFFPLMLISIGILGFFAGMKNVTVARIAMALIGLCFVTAIAVGGYREANKKEAVVVENVANTASSSDNNDVDIKGPISMMVTATKEGTKTYHFPRGLKYDIRGVRKDAHFRITTQSGTYIITPEKTEPTGDIYQASFTALTDTPEKIYIYLHK